MLRAIFRTHSRNHSMLAIYSKCPEQVVGAAIARLHRKGFIAIGSGVIRPLCTLTGARLQKLSPAEQQAMVERAIRQRKVTRCPEAHAMGELKFMPFGGRWFS